MGLRKLGRENRRWLELAQDRYDISGVQRKNSASTVFISLLWVHCTRKFRVEIEIIISLKKEIYRNKFVRVNV
jgi:hypothetical protein